MNSESIVHLFHILIIGSLFLYVGIQRTNIPAFMFPLLVGPVLVYIGYNGEKTQRLYFELLLMLGFAAIGYHGYYMLV